MIKMGTELYYSCDSCGEDVDEFCDHDERIHNWCVDCCREHYRGPYEPDRLWEDWD